MRLTGLIQLLRTHPAYGDIAANPESTLGVIGAARPLLLAALADDLNVPIIILTSSVKRAYNIAEQLPVWTDRRVYNFTEPTSQFYERVPWVESAIQGRLETLAALLAEDSEPMLVVASARALMQRTIPANQFRHRIIGLERDQRHTIDHLVRAWVNLGYEPAPIVVEPGTFSRRGGVLDIWPLGLPQPVRVDFFDDEIESLRYFDPSTQRSGEATDSVQIIPAREALPEEGGRIAAHLADYFTALPPAEDDMTTPAADADMLGTVFPYLEFYLPYMVSNPVSLLDYAPLDALIVLEDDFEAAVDDIQENAEHNRQEAGKSLPLDYPRPYIDRDTLTADLSQRRVLRVQHGSDHLFAPGERFGGQIRPMLTAMRQKQRQGSQIVVVTEQANRLRQLWYEQDTSAFVPLVDDVTEPPESLVFIQGTLHEGWSLDGRLELVTDAEIFGWNRPEPRRRKATKRSRPPESDYADWREGDYVVHVDYGVGRFQGMRHRTVDGNEREYLVIEYAENGMLFVPIHQADRLTRYIGADDTPPRLSALGKPEWTRIKSRTQKAVQEEARELLELYATRAQTTGFAYAPDNPWQHELEASFPYVETEDQLRAVREVKRDMESPHPMDRLICGDVGYGKTEVALRAAFKAVTDGKQVALLVPTTVLASQHYETFNSRLAPFPIKVEMLSRFRTREQQSRVLPRVASGEIDILIGTHRILSQDITFKELGLVIVDEEQRFGVKQKEHFKKLRNQVDVLALTATPIPRTLYMSLISVRDISTIQTPPEERLPVITHVGRFDEKLVRQAILREMERGGQVFFVHNRIRTIDTLYERLAEIVPEARIVVGHGRMNERQLEAVMTDFTHGHYDILLSTAIIESGIDIPNANTLIVDRADWFGMAQLYQLRGRVGRSAQQAYAYFFHPKKQTDDSRLRLDTLAEHTALGTGFQIAMRDLEIRGAGDILSTRQTGHVTAVGLHLYTQLLTQAIKQQQNGAKTGPSVASSGIVIDLPVAAYLPEDWIPEIALRLQIYRRIAGLTDVAQVDTMRSELHDRFGQLPIAVEGLLYQIEVKLLAQQANATHVMVERGQAQIRLPYLGEVDREALAFELGEHVAVSRTAVSFPLSEDIWRMRLLDILRALAAGIGEAN